MIKPKIAFVIGHETSPRVALRKIVKEEAEALEFDGVTISDAGCEKEIEFVKNADAIFIYSYKLSPPFLEMFKNHKGKIVSIAESYIGLSSAPIAFIRKADAFFKSGGEGNLRKLVRLMAGLTGIKVEVGEVEEVPWHGIYHPQIGSFENLSDYLNKYAHANMPLVGILFWRSWWLYRQTEAVSKLIEKIEEEGLGVIPVFTRGYRSDHSGLGYTKEESIREFFLQGGRPVIDAFVNLCSLFLLDHGPINRELFEMMKGIELLKRLDVPMIQVLSSLQSVEDWLADERGIDPYSHIYNVVMPEVDGLIEPIYVMGSIVNQFGTTEHHLYEAHFPYVARRVKRWIELRQKRPEERKLAIVLINPPCKDLEANVAFGLGLDVPESVVKLLWKLKTQGYDVGNDLPTSGEELTKKIMARKAISEFRWTSVDEIVKSGGATGFVNAETYLSWFEELPEKVRKEMIMEWGDPRDVLEGRISKELVGMVYSGEFVVPGLLFGNVLITVQPKSGCAGSACNGKVCRILHNSTIPPPHQWLAVYRWISRKFNSDMIVHFGTYGYLEFRPGKGIGLSQECWPEISIDDVPHLYVYTVSNPMDGMIAKRRGYAVLIDHLCPPMTTAPVLDELNDLLNQYAKATMMREHNRAEILYDKLIEASKKYNVPMPSTESREKKIEEISRFVELVRGSQVNLGLHVLGNPPKESRKLAEYVVTTMSYDSRYSQSIKRIIANYLSLDYEELRKEPMKLNREYKVPNRELLSKLTSIAVNILEKMISVNSSEVNLVFELLKEEVRDSIGSIITECNIEDITAIFSKALDIAQRIMKCEKELPALLKGFSGCFIEPSPSGSITRGNFEVLPTGRNFYSVDPRALPTPAAWEVGVKTAKKTLSYYFNKNSRYPESIGHVLWSTDAYKADGEQLAQILYLLGTRPKREQDGTVVGLEIIPLEELKRPRIDCLTRISGMVRDSLPNYTCLIDEAVEKVVALEESLETNFIRKHYLEYVKELIKLNRGTEEAKIAARYRVFCSPPGGSYGPGVDYQVEASAWKSDEDLAKTWIQWAGYAYGKSSQGIKAHDVLSIALRDVDAVSRNHSSDEHDLLDCCYYAYDGGFCKAANAISGKEVEPIYIDTRDSSNLSVRDFKIEIERITRAKLFNPIWIQEMKKHGYKGASEFSLKILHLYGWLATTKRVEKWILDEIAKTYVLNEEMQQWFEKHNVWALEEIIRRLVEAAERGLWTPPDELLEQIKEAYAEIEGILEESITSEAERQGGTIAITTSEEVDHWKNGIKEVETIWKKVKRETGD
jgi:cobaltochelatase CobN